MAQFLKWVGRYKLGVGEVWKGGGATMLFTEYNKFKKKQRISGKSLLF